MKKIYKKFLCCLIVIQMFAVAFGGVSFSETSSLYSNNYNTEECLDFDTVTSGSYTGANESSIIDYSNTKLLKFTITQNNTAMGWGNFRFHNVTPGLVDEYSGLKDGESMVFEYSLMLDSMDMYEYTIQPIGFWMCKFLPDGNIQTAKTSSRVWTNVGKWEAGEWMNISFVLYPENKFDMYINGEQVVSNEVMGRWLDPNWTDTRKNRIENYLKPTDFAAADGKSIYINSVNVTKYTSGTNYIPPASTLSGRIYNNVVYYNASDNITAKQLKDSLSVSQGSYIAVVNKDGSFISDGEMVGENAKVIEIAPNNIYSFKARSETGFPLYINRYENEDDMDFDVGCYNGQYNDDIVDYIGGKCYKNELKAAAWGWNYYRFNNKMENVYQTQQALTDGESMSFEYSVMIKGRVDYEISPIGLWMTKFKPDGTIATTTNEGSDKQWNSVGNWVEGQWNNISVVLRKDRMFDMYINGKQVVNNKKMYYYFDESGNKTTDRNRFLNKVTPDGGWNNQCIYLDNVVIKKYNADEKFENVQPVITGNIMNNVIMYNGAENVSVSKLLSGIQTNMGRLAVMKTNGEEAQDSDIVTTGMNVANITDEKMYVFDTNAFENKLSITDDSVNGNYIYKCNFDDALVAYPDGIDFPYIPVQNNQTGENWQRGVKEDLEKAYPNANWNGFISYEIKGEKEGTIKIKKLNGNSSIEFTGNNCNEYIRFGDSTRSADKRYLIISSDFSYIGAKKENSSRMAALLMNYKNSDGLSTNLLSIREKDNQLVALSDDNTIELGYFVDEGKNFKAKALVDTYNSTYDIYVNNKLLAKDLPVSKGSGIEFVQVYMTSSYDRVLNINDYSIFNVDKNVNLQLNGIADNNGDSVNIPIKNFAVSYWNTDYNNIMFVPVLYDSNDVLKNASINYAYENGNIVIGEAALSRNEGVMDKASLFLWEAETLKSIMPAEKK